MNDMTGAAAGPRGQRWKAYWLPPRLRPPGRQRAAAVAAARIIWARPEGRANERRERRRRDPQRRSGFRRAGVLAAVLSSLALLAACGGPAAPSATHAESQKSALLAFSSCIRAHGVPDFPDPQPAGGFARSALNPIDQNSPQFLAAEKACRSLAIASGFEHTPAELRKHVQQEIAESLCMRKHGVPNMPLPNAQGQMVFPAGGPNPSQPQFQAAQRHCAYLNP